MPQLRIKRVANKDQPTLHIWHVYRYNALIGEITRLRDAAHDKNPYQAFLIANNGRRKPIGKFFQKDGRNRAIRVIGMMATRENEE